MTQFFLIDSIFFVIGCIFILVSVFCKSGRQRNHNILYTDLSIDECKEHLNSSIDTRPRCISIGLNPISVLLRKEQKLICGKIIENKFEIEKRTFANNSFKPIFHGTFNDDNPYLGTCIEGTFDTSLNTKIFVYIFVIICTLIFSISLFAIIRDIISGNIIGRSHVIGLVQSISMFVFLVGLNMFVKLVGNKEEEFIFNFLEEKLEARENN